jgi:CMP-N-acetylneuraminic acid synthetase
MRIVAMIPVKSNSQRLPGKNFIPFLDDKSLLRISLEKITKVSEFDEIVVFSSSEIDSTHFENSRARLILRPKQLDSDSTSMNEIILAFIRAVDADIYVLIHVTSPFISNSKILEGIDMIRRGRVASSMSVTEHKTFMWDKDLNPNYDIIEIPRTQDIPSFYVETSGFYAFTKLSFIKNNSRISKNPGFVIVGSIEAIDIDTIEDFQFAKMIGEIK